MTKKFELDEDQMSRLEDWQAGIKKKYGEYGLYTYSFTPTGIGDIIKVYSDTAKKTLDLSDVDKW